MAPALPFGTVHEFTAFAVVLGRLAGIFAAIPMFGGKIVANRVKAAAILAMTLLLFPVVYPRLPSLPADSLGLILLMAGEALIGISLGLFAQMAFAAVELSGAVVSMQMGLSIAAQFDPTLGSQVSSLSVLKNILAMLLFLALGAHHIFIRAVVDSYQLIPVGGWHMSAGLLKFMMATLGSVFVLGVKLAAPVMVSLLAANVVLGIMARAFPQMNVFMVSMPINLGFGFLMLGFSLLVFLHALQGTYAGFPAQIKVLFKLLGQG